MFSGLVGGGGSAKRAANVAAQGQANARAALEKQLATSTSYYTPYQDAGTAALGQYQNIAGTLPQYTDRINQYASSMDPIVAKITSDNLNDYQNSPGYDFRFQQGQRALEASRAAGGNLNSGATGKALLEYGQGIGSAEYQNYLGNLYNQLGAVGTQIGGVQAGQQSAQGSLDAYGNLINTGYNAANANAQLGMNAAGQIGQTYTGEANAQAGGMMAKDAQMKAAGDQWIGAGATVAGAFLGGPMGAQAGASMAPKFSGVGQQQFGNQTSGQPTQGQAALGGFAQGFGQGWNSTTQPQVGMNMGAYLPTQQAQPWVNPDAGLQQQAMLGTQSGYKPQQYSYV